MHGLVSSRVSGCDVKRFASLILIRKICGLVLAAILALMIHVPAYADRPCSGGDDNFARPIAAILQPNASAYNPNGRFEVAMKSNADLTTDITIGHSLGDRKLFRAITRLKTSNPSSAVVGQLPVNEGVGFSIQVAEGGSSYTEICTYGFRFQKGVVSYRTLAAKAETREGGIYAGDATAWKLVAAPSASITQPNSFDGTYYQESYRFGFSVIGNQGVATVSNSPTYKPGDVMLSFTPSSPKTFSGQQLCTDGKFHPVNGTLADDGSIDMVIQGCFPSRYKMVRQGTPTQARDGGYSAPQNASSATTSRGTVCDAPRVVIDKPSPTCRERWQTVIFRSGVGKVFFATNEYIDAWQKSADTGELLGEILANVADLALLTKGVMELPDLASKVGTIVFRGNTFLLMLGLDQAPDTLGVEFTRQAVEVMRSAIEGQIEQGLTGSVSLIGVAPQVAKLANSLLALANTVRYSRLRNTYTVALEYLRLLYRMGGDHVTFAQSLGLADKASVRDCINAVNKKSFGFPTSLTDANAYNPDLVEKVVNYWVLAISDYAALKAP